MKGASKNYKLQVTSYQVQGAKLINSQNNKLYRSVKG